MWGSRGMISPAIALRRGSRGSNTGPDGGAVLAGGGSDFSSLSICASGSSVVEVAPRLSMTVVAMAGTCTEGRESSVTSSGPNAFAAVVRIGASATIVDDEADIMSGTNAWVTGWTPVVDLVAGIMSGTTLGGKVGATLDIGEPAAKA